MPSGNKVDQFGTFIYWVHSDTKNVPVTVSLPAPASNRFWQIDEILYGYENAPMGSRELTINLGSDENVRREWTADAGIKRFSGQGSLRGETGKAVSVRLEADAVGLGKVEVRARQGTDGPPT